jgi:hypothetical protein
MRHASLHVVLTLLLLLPPPLGLTQRRTQPAMRLHILEDKHAVGQYTAEYIVKRINDFAPSADRPFVLGLPTGASLSSSYVHPLSPHRQHTAPHLPGARTPVQGGCGVIQACGDIQHGRVCRPAARPPRELPLVHVGQSLQAH